MTARQVFRWAKARRAPIVVVLVAAIAARFTFTKARELNCLWGTVRTKAFCEAQAPEHPGIYRDSKWPYPVATVSATETIVVWKSIFGGGRTCQKMGREPCACAWEEGMHP